MEHHHHQVIFSRSACISMLQDWLKECQIRSLLHTQTSQYYDFIYTCLSTITILCGSISGIGSFTNVSNDCSSSVNIVITVFCILNIFLTGIKTIYRLDKTSTQHSQMATNYQVLIRDIQFSMLHQPPLPTHLNNKQTKYTRKQKQLVVEDQEEEQEQDQEEQEQKHKQIMVQEVEEEEEQDEEQNQEEQEDQEQYQEEKNINMDMDYQYDMSVFIMKIKKKMNEYISQSLMIPNWVQNRVQNQITTFIETFNHQIVKDVPVATTTTTTVTIDSMNNNDSKDIVAIASATGMLGDTMSLARRFSNSPATPPKPFPSHSIVSQSAPPSPNYYRKNKKQILYKRRQQQEQKRKYKPKDKNIINKELETIKIIQNSLTRSQIKQLNSSTTIKKNQ